MNEPISKPPWTVEVFYDGQCPLCCREIGMIRWLDRRERLRLTDISTPEFRPADYQKSMDDFMSEIQGRLPDGQWIIGVEVFRQLYAAVGLGWLVAITRWPGISRGLDFGYRVFAKNRLRLTGRCTPDSCQIPSADSPRNS